LRVLSIILVAVLSLQTLVHARLNIIDYRIEEESSSFWKAHYDIPAITAVMVVGLAGYEGGKSRLGKTAWKSIDAAVLSTLLTTGFKHLTRRVRPYYTDNPNFWHEKGRSFPSQHVSGLTALVTPFVLEYQEEYPLVHLLWALPAHQMIGRVKSQAHWQSDVLAGFALGVVSGLVAHHNDTPLLFSITPEALQVGFKHKF
jgi:undecaprenyl-diphosphatase